MRRHARTLGLLETHKHMAAQRRAGTKKIETKALIAGLKRLARLASGELERRLKAKPGEIQTRDSIVLAGVAVDKIRDFEDWRGGSELASNNVAAQELEALFRASKAGGRFHVTRESRRRSSWYSVSGSSSVICGVCSIASET